MLYKVITLRSDRNTSALQSVALNPVKAAYVKRLSIEFDYEIRGTDAEVMELFIRAAPEMRNLKDLRVRLRHDLRRYVPNLTEVLW